MLGEAILFNIFFLINIIGLSSICWAGGDVVIKIYPHYPPCYINTAYLLALNKKICPSRN